MGGELAAGLIKPFMVFRPSHVNPISGNVENFDGDKKFVALAEIATFAFGGVRTGKIATTELANPLSRVVEQYSLRALADGWYPVMKRGTKDAVEATWLQAGEVWKFGTTVNPGTRYSQTYLDSIGTRGVQYVREFGGALNEAITVQNMKIKNFLRQTGELPPGNKIIN